VKVSQPECHLLNFLGRSIGAQCPLAKSLSWLALETAMLAEMHEEASTGCRDTQSQRSPSEGLDALTNLVPQGGSQARASPGHAREHWDRSEAGVIRLTLQSTPY